MTNPNHHRRLLYSLLLLLVISPLLLGTTSAQAAAAPTPQARRSSSANYDFRLLNETVKVTPNIDASALINYTIEFQNYGSEFDYIDVGLPNSRYDLSTARAYWELQGQPITQLTSIEPSTEISIGVQIYVPIDQQPNPGQTGTLTFWITCHRMVYIDTVNEGYVGYEFVPTWFDPELCQTVEELNVHLSFPDGFYNGTQAFYHYVAYDRWYNDTDSLVYVWEWGSHYPGSHYTTERLRGISFPYDEAYITTYYTAGFEEWWEAWGEIAIILIAVAAFFSICIAVIAIQARKGFSAFRRGTGYLPPSVKIETLGVRRGLTVVEAAALNETPLNRVFLMIIFGMLRKGLIMLDRKTPKGKPLFLTNPGAIAKPTGKIHYYERLLLKAISPKGNLLKPAIRKLLNTLIKTTARKLEGYNRTQTQQHYQAIIQKAWKQMQKATTPAQQAKTLDKYAEWLIADPKYEERLREYPTYHAPYWYYHWIWHTSPHPTTHTTHTPSTTTPQIQITNFANAVVLGTQNFANTVVTGFQNLANAITQAFRPPTPVSTGRRGGGSCACACACASCACACAGGGR